MCAVFNALRMYALNAPGSENVDQWRPRAHEFKVHVHERHHNNTRMNVITTTRARLHALACSINPCSCACCVHVLLR